MKNLITALSGVTAGGGIIASTIGTYIQNPNIQIGGAIIIGMGAVGLGVSAVMNYHDLMMAVNNLPERSVKKELNSSGDYFGV